MPDIYLDLPVMAPPPRVFQALTSSQGLDAWWTLKSQGKPTLNETYQLFFGKEYDWRAKVIRCIFADTFELQMTAADNDWMNTIVGFHLEPRDGATWLSFYHTGWPELNEHFRSSAQCWAQYLRLLKRYVEKGEVIAYADRLDV